MGGNGGNGNYAQGGDISSAVVHSDPSTETALSSFADSFNHADWVGIDLSHFA